MIFTVILVAVVLLPVVLVLWWRSHAAIAFMALCLGSVLAAYASADVVDAITGFTPLSISDLTMWVKIGLLVLPLILSLLFTSKSVNGAKQIAGFVPALATGMLLAVLVMPFLPAEIQRQMRVGEVWDTLSNLQTATLLAGAFFSLLFLFVSHKKFNKEEPKK